MELFKKLFSSKELKLEVGVEYSLFFKKATLVKSLFLKNDPIKGRFFWQEETPANTAKTAVFVGVFPLHHLAVLWEENGSWVECHSNAVDGVETLWVFYSREEDDYFVLLPQNLSGVKFNTTKSNFAMNLAKLDPSVIDARTAEAAEQHLNFLKMDCESNPGNYSFHNEWFPFLTAEARDAFRRKVKM